MSEPAYKSYKCLVCGFIYHEENGFPEERIAPQTRWEDLPEHWKCPDCGVAKTEFELVEDC